jgi:hypothetical protein
LLVEKPEPVEPVALVQEYEMATDWPTSASCGEQEMEGVGVWVRVELVGTHWYEVMHPLPLPEIGCAVAPAAHCGAEGGVVQGTPLLPVPYGACCCVGDCVQGCCDEPDPC